MHTCVCVFQRQHSTTVDSSYTIFLFLFHRGEGLVSCVRFLCCLFQSPAIPRQRLIVWVVKGKAGHVRSELMLAAQTITSFYQH